VWCAKGEVHWDQIATAGQEPHDLAHPAPTLTIFAQSDGMRAHGEHKALPDRPQAMLI
jgi:periplasmic copper chaperone A